MPRFSVDLTGFVALVTGAGSGVGRATAEVLAGAGAAVCVHDVNPDRANQVLETIQAADGRAIAWTADVSNRFQVAAMIEAIREQLGGLQILINAARVHKETSLLLVDEYDWRRIVEINLTGAFFCTQLASRVMADDGGGVIVNVDGTSGSPVHGVSTAFATSQAGLLGLTRDAAYALAAKGVRVNAVRYANIMPEPKPVDPQQIPQARTGTPNEVAAVVLFLCSDAASYVNGQTITVAGGEHLP
ncbi:MAG: SDR family oxidoreductase [Chloroflexi bacterium]|nr:SDR family oxidoreductase [Chloroflexota bacterium]